MTLLNHLVIDVKTAYGYGTVVPDKYVAAVRVAVTPVAMAAVVAVTPVAMAFAVPPDKSVAAAPVVTAPVAIMACAVMATIGMLVMQFRGL